MGVRQTFGNLKEIKQIESDLRQPVAADNLMSAAQPTT